MARHQSIVNWHVIWSMSAKKVITSTDYTQTWNLVREICLCNVTGNISMGHS